MRIELRQRKWVENHIFLFPFFSTASHTISSDSTVSSLFFSLFCHFSLLFSIWSPKLVLHFTFKFQVSLFFIEYLLNPLFHHSQILTSHLKLCWRFVISHFHFLYFFSFSIFLVQILLNYLIFVCYVCSNLGKLTKP